MGKENVTVAPCLTLRENSGVWTEAEFSFSHQCLPISGRLRLKRRLMISREPAVRVLIDGRERAGFAVPIQRSCVECAYRRRARPTCSPRCRRC